MSKRSLSLFAAAAALLFLRLGATASTEGAPEDGDRLVAALQKGGLILLMRHASSPRELPDEAGAAPGNTTRERQLDAGGRESAAAMGRALRELRIPVGEVWSSPTWRARETAQQAGFPAPRLVTELGDAGRGMQAADAAQGAWLRQQLAQRPSQGNRVMITHFPNIAAAFPQQAAGLADGEALVLEPGAPEARLLGRIRIEAWPRLAGAR